jgi:DNA-binding CsgD family transcriptional regulator
MRDVVSEGRAAFERAHWKDAHALLTTADARRGLEPEDLVRLSTAAYLIGRDAESADAGARAYQGFVDRGARQDAARCAFWIAFAIMDARDRQAEAGGWLARAKRLLEEAAEPGAVQGLLQCAFALQHIGTGGVDASLAAFHEAAEIGARFGDLDVVALARHGEGRALIRLGRLAEGLALLDEVMVGVSRRETTPIITGVVYCSVISACHELFDWRRAREWTDALADWCGAHPDMVPFRGACLVRRSEVLQWHGAWTSAFAEAVRACEWLDREASGPQVGLAHAQRAELHRLRGEFAEAEEAYRRASQAGARVDPGLALLRLARGETEAAAAAIRRALQETRDRRSRALVLRGAVDILIAAGDTNAAHDAAAELGTLAGTLDVPCLHAMAETAAGAVAVAAGRPGDAVAPLGDAVARWQLLGAPYEAARARTLVGLACRALGDRDGAALELEAAHDAFDRLGARPDADRLADLLRDAPAPSARGGLTGREVEVLRLVAAGRTNRAVAAELGISEKTVARHLSNIFTKLDLSSRSAATAYAYEHKLV